MEDSKGWTDSTKKEVEGDGRKMKMISLRGGSMSFEMWVRFSL